MSVSRAINAVKWSFAGEISARAIQPLVFIVMARLLTPADFGIAAAGLMVISFSQIFWEGGFAKAIIQYQTQVDDAASTAFWLNITLGLVIIATLFAVAPLISKIVFHDARVAAVLWVMNLQILLGSLTSIPTALMQKHMRFDQIFWLRFAAAAAPALISVPLAVMGWSYWALVAGTLTGQIVQTVLVWRISKWRPKILFKLDAAVEIAKFGRWSVLSGLLSWFYIWADALIVGIYLGPGEFGLYRTGSQFVVMIYGLVFTPILPVLYSHLSSLGMDSARIGATLVKAMHALLLAGLPLAFVILTFSGILETSVFGSRWHGVGMIISVIALVQGYTWVVGADGEAYRALGKPSYETIVSGLSLGIYLIGYVASIQYGLKVFLWTRFGLALVAVFFHLLLNRRILGVNISAIYARQFLLTVAGIMFYACFVSANLSLNFWWKVAIGLPCLAGVGLIIWTPQVRGDAAYLWGLLKRGI